MVKIHHFYINLKSKNKAKVPDYDQARMRITEDMEDFKLMAKFDGRTKATIDQYDYELERFVDYSSNEIKIGNITTKKIKKYLSSLMKV